MSESSLTTPAPVPAEKIGLRAAEAAKLLGLGRTCFYGLHRSGRLPRPRRLGRVVLWDAAELRAWFAAGAPSRQRWEALRNGEGSGA